MFLAGVDFLTMVSDKLPSTDELGPTLGVGAYTALHIWRMHSRGAVCVMGNPLFT